MRSMPCIVIYPQLVDCIVEPGYGSYPLRPYLFFGMVSDFATVLMILTNSFSAASMYCPMISMNKSLLGSSIFLQLGCALIHSGTHLSSPNGLHHVCLELLFYMFVYDGIDPVKTDMIYHIYKCTNVSYFRFYYRVLFRVYVSINVFCSLFCYYYESHTFHMYALWGG